MFDSVRESWIYSKKCRYETQFWDQRDLCKINKAETQCHNRMIRTISAETHQEILALTALKILPTVLEEIIIDYMLQLMNTEMEQMQMTLANKYNLWNNLIELIEYVWRIDDNWQELPNITFILTPTYPTYPTIEYYNTTDIQTTDEEEDDDDM